ncbi:MAG: GNAT family N-acetyltransferase [Elusimicrobiales bacterium]|nr:GNAT family N-acetyltransferase [Elusimicrobiales bacterium]
MSLKIKAIKNPNINQLNQIKDIYIDAGWWYDYDNIKRLQKIVKKTYLFIIAELDGNIVGMARVISDGVNDAYIQDFAVKKKFRKNGIGSKIIEYIILYLKKRDFKWIGLIAEKKAYSLYKRFGFKMDADKKPMIYETKKA